LLKNLVSLFFQLNKYLFPGIVFYSNNSVIKNIQNVNTYLQTNKDKVAVAQYELLLQFQNEISKSQQVIQTHSQHALIYHFNFSQSFAVLRPNLAVKYRVQALKENDKLRLQTPITCKNNGYENKHKAPEHKHRVVQNDPIAFLQHQIWVKLLVHRAIFWARQGDFGI